MTPKYSPILWRPPKNIHKIFIPQKLFIFLKPPKNIEIQIWTPKNDPSIRTCMYENISVPSLGVWRKPRQPPVMPMTQAQIFDREHTKLVGSIVSATLDWFLMLSLILWIVFVRRILRVSDFIKNEFELLFFINKLQFLVLSVYFVVSGNLTDLCLSWTWFLMISRNPSSKCQRVWLQIRLTFDTSICTELKGLVSYGVCCHLLVFSCAGSRNFCPENFKFARFWEGDPAFSRWST